MITARDANGKAIFATRDENGVAPEAFCPCCHKRMLARVGEQRRPHWAHEAGERCDEWMEEESEWRNAWIAEFVGSANVDVENVCERNGTRHFYDIRFGGRQIAIFRRRKLTREQLRLREEFFGDMFWFVEGKASEYARLKSHLGDRSIRPIRGAERCFECSAFAYPSPFFSRWAECGMPVVYDFGAVNPDGKTPLWCVLPADGKSRILLKFPVGDFMHRLKSAGTLLRWSVEEVDRRIRAISAEHEIKVATKVAPTHKWEYGRLVPKHTVIEKRKHPAPIPAPPRKSYDELVSEFIGYGFSRADAENKARLQLEK